MNLNQRLFSFFPHVGIFQRIPTWQERLVLKSWLMPEIEKRWKEHKFDKVEQPNYNVLLPYVDPDVSNSVQILNSARKVTFEFSGKQKIL